LGRQWSWRADLLDPQRCGTDHDLLRVGAEMVRREPGALRPGTGCNYREIRNPKPQMTESSRPHPRRPGHAHPRCEGFGPDKEEDFGDRFIHRWAEWR